MTMRMMCALAVGALLAACGGSSDSGRKFKDPNSVTFAYAEGVGDVNSDAARSMTEQASEAAAIAPSGDIAGGLVQGYMIAGAPLIANGYVFDGVEDGLGIITSSAVLQDQRLSILRGAVAQVVGAGSEPPYVKVDVDCSVTVDATGLLVDHCNGSVIYAADPTSIRASAHLSGTFSNAAGVVAWHFTMSVDADYADPASALSGSLYADLKGELAVADGAMTGYSRVAYALDLSDTDSSVPETPVTSTLAAAVTDQVDCDLTYYAAIPDMPCVTGGTLTLKRVWTDKPVGTGDWAVDPADFSDQSVRFTFTGGAADTCYTGVTYEVGSLAAD